MSGESVILAAEDTLGEVVSIRILASLDIGVSQRLGLRGKGYLQNKADGLNRTAQGFPVFMLTDQDTPNRCPPQLVQSWLSGMQHPHFFLRVAVMEVESWIMADREGVAELLAIPLSRIPSDTDTIPHPKEFLVTLARRSRKTSLRKELIPRPGTTSKVGPEYNSRLGEFVRSDWHIGRASATSNSLKRTVDRLKTFRAT